MCITVIFDDEEIELACDRCGGKVKKNVGWIKGHNQFTCPCGAIVHLNIDETRREIEKINAKAKTLGHIGKKTDE